MRKLLLSLVLAVPSLALAVDPDVPADARAKFVKALAAKKNDKKFLQNPLAFAPSIGSGVKDGRLLSAIDFEQGAVGVPLGITATVKQIVDKHSVLVTAKLDYIGSRKTLYSDVLIVGVDTSKLLDDGDYPFSASAYHVAGTAKVGARTVVKFVPLTLTETEKRELGIK